MSTVDPTPPRTPGEAIDLDAVEARANAATPGPWHEEHIGTDTCVSIGDYGWVVSGLRAPEYDVDSEQGRDDAEFIAHARADVPALVAEVRRVRAERDFAHQLRDQAAAVREHDRRQAERAILRWAADRIAAELARVEVLEAPADIAHDPDEPPTDAARRQLIANAIRDREQQAELDTAPAPVYQLPAEPPPEVTELWEVDTGRRWDRYDVRGGWWDDEATVAVLDALTADGWEPRCDCDGVAHDLPILRSYIRGEPGCTAHADEGDTDAR